MKVGMCVLLALCGLLVAGCSKEVSDKRGASETAAKSKEKTSREVIHAQKVIREELKRRGWKLGYDEERGRIIAVGESFEENGTVDEAMRQRCFRKAFDEAVRDLAEMIKIEVPDADKDGRTPDEDKGKVVAYTHEMLYGATPLLAAESWMSADAEYETSVAVVMSSALENSVKKALKREKVVRSKPGKLSLEKWLEKQDVATMLGSRQFVDDKGDRWFIGSVSDDGKMLPYLKSWAKEAQGKGEIGEFDEKGLKDSKLTRRLLKSYAVWTVARMLAVDVECTKEFATNEECVAVEICKYDLRVTAKVRLDVDDGQIKWFERKAVSPTSGKKIKVLSCAIRLADVARMRML